HAGHAPADPAGRDAARAAARLRAPARVEPGDRDRGAGARVPPARRPLDRAGAGTEDRRGSVRRAAMKGGILAGGLGTRLSEETVVRPKPMVEIGGHPILLHIMSLYARHGFTDFLIACGYKGELIKQYFRDFAVRQSDFVVNLKDGALRMLEPPRLDWQ